MSFDVVPEDVIEYIMLHLTPYGDMQNCRLVSRQWYRLATGAMQRLNRLFKRCDAFEWYLLQQPESNNYHHQSTIAERCSHAACYHPTSGSLYVFGGCTAHYTTFNDLWRFNLAQRAWYRPIPMGTFPTPKACATMVEYNGQLLLFGGWSKSSPNPIHQTAMFFNEMHAYNVEHNTWTEISDSNAPHLAGHSATMLGNRMIVFGGSLGNTSSNNVYVYDVPTRRWSQPDAGPTKPAPRYGQSQAVLDDTNLLIVGGCGGPNMIFSDVWLLTLCSGDQSWTWTEITVTNPQLSAPQVWSHPSCVVGSKVAFLSKPQRCRSGSLSHRQISSAVRRSSLTTESNLARSTGSLRSDGKTWVPPQSSSSAQGKLVPPVRKLLSSKSLDEQDTPPSPSNPAAKKFTELQRASSIPAIIVGEIPRLVVTKEDNSGDSTGSGGGGGGGGPPTASGHNDMPGPSHQYQDHHEGRIGNADEQRRPCIAMAASSLLPNQATEVDPGSVEGTSYHNANRSQQQQRSSRPSVRPNASNDRGKQLQMLARMEEYIHSRSRAQTAQSPSPDSQPLPTKAPTFRFSSPPPKSKQSRPSDFASLSRNPMCVYCLETNRVLTDREAVWSIAEPDPDAPEDTILYSLVAARGEMVMFGGMRSGNTLEQQGLGVVPFTHTITNETFVLRPPINF